MEGNFGVGKGDVPFMFLDGVQKFLGATFSEVERTQAARGWMLP